MSPTSVALVAVPGLLRDVLAAVIERAPAVVLEPDPWHADVIVVGGEGPEPRQIFASGVRRVIVLRDGGRRADVLEVVSSVLEDVTPEALVAAVSRAPGGI